MLPKVFFKILLFSQLLNIGLLKSQPNEKSLSQYFDRWITAPSLQSASIGILVLDKKGNEILAYNPNKSLVPASVQKLLTTAVALNQLTPEFRFETKIWYTGTLDQHGILTGDIWLEGGGDPTLGSDRYGGMNGVANKIINCIKAAGIKTINGKIKTNTDIIPQIIIPRTWIWEDIGNYYGAVPSGLTFHDNSYEVSLSSPSEIGELCKIEDIFPPLNHLKFDCKVTAANNQLDNAYIFGNKGSTNRIITGTIPKGKSNFKIKGAISNPEWAIKNWLSKALEYSEIGFNKVDNKIEFNQDNLHLICRLKSPNLVEIVNQTNQNSINLYAEHLAIRVNERRGSELTIEQSAGCVKHGVSNMGIDTQGMFLVDGSGLSRFNGVTAGQMVGMLNFMQNSTNDSYFKNSLAIAGKSGTLKRMFYNSPATGKISAKSGYMERVRSYAGYIKKSEKEEYTFCIMVNNYTGSAAAMKYHIKQLLEKLAE